MANSKLIVVEGPQGVGKTTITDFLRYTLKHTNLYRLSGTSDSSKEGLNKSKEMYFDLLEYIKKLENKSINLLFDRTFFTEEVYCRLGLKEYSFTTVYKLLLKQFSNLDFELYYITLYLKDESLFEKRLNRSGKADVHYAKFSTQNSVSQQKMYLNLAKEINKLYPNIKTINIDNGKSLENTKSILKEFIGF